MYRVNKYRSPDKANVSREKTVTRRATTNETLKKAKRPKLEAREGQKAIKTEAKPARAKNHVSERQEKQLGKWREKSAN